MYQFDMTIHARPSNIRPGSPLVVGGREVVPLVVEAGEAGEPLPVSFESALDALSNLPRMFVEPDGSFVWVSAEPPAWQVDGVLYDRGGSLLFVELRGRCTAERFDDLLAVLEWPDSALMFQLRREALFLDEEQFRSYAAVNR